MNCALKYIVLAVLVTNAALAQISREKEIALGQQVSKLIESKSRLISDDRVTGFVDQVLNKLSRNASLRLPLQVRVLDTPEPIASGLVGGFLLLSSGAIL